MFLSKISKKQHFFFLVFKCIPVALRIFFRQHVSASLSLPTKIGYFIEIDKYLTQVSHVVQERAEGPKAPSPGHRPGYNGSQQGAL